MKILMRLQYAHIRTSLELSLELLENYGYFKGFLGRRGNKLYIFWAEKIYNVFAKYFLTVSQCSKLEGSTPTSLEHNTSIINQYLCKLCLLILSLCWKLKGSTLLTYTYT